MALPWGYIGDVANVAQLTGLDAVRLISMIVEAASTARMHKKNCQQFAQQLTLVSNLLEELSVSELKKHCSTRQPLELLEDALRRSYILVSSCHDRSYPYLLVMGMNILKQFRSAQDEISQYLGLIPLITLVDIQRDKERTENIKRDQIEYTLGEADKKVQDALSNPGCLIAETGSNTKIGISNIDRLEINDVVLRIFKFKELRRATMDFRHENLLAQGGFGPVYKGWIKNNSWKAANNGPGFLMPGTTVAVTRLGDDAQQGDREWEAELNFLGKMLHSNVIKLLGYCSKAKERFLVYEFMPNGSLFDHLFSSGRGGASAALRPLSWELRIKIAVGVARALAFLHASHVIHRDVKSRNILLDTNFNPRLSDFGLAINGPTDRDSYLEDIPLCGTVGYFAPDYYRDGRLNEKADVYAFGMLLLEILTGKYAYDIRRKIFSSCLSGYQELASLMDPRLHGQYPLKAALRAAQLAQICVPDDPTSRPSMEEAVKTLEQIQTMDMLPTKLAPTQVSDPCPFLHDISYLVSRTMVYESAPFDADTELSFSKLRSPCSGGSGGATQRMWRTQS